MSEACLSATRALCNHCAALVDAQIVSRDGRVHLVKWCPEHGRSEALVCSDEGWYRASLGYVKPATAPLARAVATFQGCPDSCGLCPEHGQHTCVPLLEVTDLCNLDCPVCLVGQRQRRHLALREVEAMLDRLVAAEGRINMLTLTGGEPTLHPELLAVVDAARRPEIGIVSLSTNGLRLAQDERLLAALCERGVVISLQLDGVEPATYGTLRGRPEFAELKLRLVERVLALGGRLSLTMTLGRGVNEHEVGAVLGLLFAHERVVSLMVQPLSYGARLRQRWGEPPADPITVPDVVRLLCESSHGVLTRSDFTPLPCSHPSCFTLSYLLRGADRSLVPLGRVLPADVYLDTIKNQALLDTNVEALERVKDALYELWSSSGMVPNRDAVLGTVKQLLLALNRLGRAPAHRQVLDLGVEHVKSIFIHHFMDRYTFDLSRAVKCCNHYPQLDGRLLPACVRNNLPRYADDQARPDAAR